MQRREHASRFIRVRVELPASNASRFATLHIVAADCDAADRIAREWSERYYQHTPSGYDTQVVVWPYSEPDAPVGMYGVGWSD